MTDLTPFDRLDRYIEQGRLIRKAWREGERTADGYERACLLVALAPEVGETREESDCPASTLWPWLAELTPWLDDVGSEEKWPNVVRRYAAVVRRLDHSDDAASRRALLGSLHAIVTEARSHASGRYAAACDHVLTLLHEGPPADDPRWEEAAEAAMEAAWAWAAWAATREAWVAEARMAARAAMAPEATMAARAAMAAAGAVNGEAAADRIIDGILTALESEAKP